MRRMPHGLDCMAEVIASRGVAPRSWEVALKPRRRVIGALVFTVAGVALILSGIVLYQAAVSAADQRNAMCLPGEPCPLAIANPLGLWIAILGGLLVVISLPLWVRAAFSTQATRSTAG